MFKLLNCIVLFLALPLLCLTLLASCKSKSELQDADDKTISIPLAGNRIVPVDDIFEEIRYISLETNKFSLLNDLANFSFDQLVLKDGYIYVKSGIGSPIFIFDESGKWIRTIGREGEGAEEYIRIYNFDVNNSREIAVLDDIGKRRIVFYSWEGKFLASATYRNYPPLRAVHYLNDSLLIIHTPQIVPNGNNNKFQVLDRNTLSFVNSFWPAPVRGVLVAVSHSFVEYQDKTIFYEPINHHIYELTADSASLRYSINVGGKMPPENFWEIKDENQTWQDQWQIRIEEGYIDDIMFFCESPENILLEFHGTSDSHKAYALVNKESRNSVLIDKIAFDSNFVWRPGRMYSRSDGIVIIPIPAHSLLEWGEGEVRKLFPNLSEEDNPILFIGKLR